MKLKSISIIFLLLLSISFISAECEWSSWGNIFTPAWNEVLSPTTCYGRFDAGISNISTNTEGLATGNQPLISYFNSTTPFLVVANGNYIDFYDSDLNLVSQKNIGTIATQLDLADMNGDAKDEVVALVTYNSTWYELKVFTFDTDFYSINQTFQQNFTRLGTATALRHHSSNNIYFLNGVNFTTINESGILENFAVVGGNQPLSSYDVDNDGDRDILTWDSGAGNITIFDLNQNIIFNEGAFAPMSSVKLIPASCHKQWWELWESCSAVEWKVVGLWGVNGIGSPARSSAVYLNVWSLDGSTYWGGQIDAGASDYCGGYWTTWNYDGGDMAISDDYNGDGYADIYVGYGLTQSECFAGSTITMRVYSGKDGTLLKSKSYSVSGGSSYLTIADMNHDGKYDFVFASGSQLYIYSPFDDDLLYSSSSLGLGSYYVEADLNNDGYLESVGSSDAYTIMLKSSATNLNAYITQVVYDPAITFQIGNTLNAYISATDPESDQIFYFKKCTGADDWSSTSSTATCVYNATGIYSMSVGARDFFHPLTSIVTQSISVTETGVGCGDLICQEGENYQNCPSDCPSQNYTQAEGGISIPQKIVDVDNVNSGLLPEIYYGTLGFLSNVLQPMIILIFVILFAFILLAIGSIIKKIATKT